MAPAQICSRCSGPLAADAVHGLCPGCLVKAGLGSAAFKSPPPVADSKPETPPSPSELGPFFPQFNIVELCGQGGMGMVYKARQTTLDRTIALKILRPSYGGTAEFSQRFEREAKALARLSHPNIVSIHDFGRAGPYYFLSMEYVDGQSLADLQRSRRLSVEESLHIGSKVCDALQFAHDGGLVHRDIKPANILIDAKGFVKMGDFGLAKILDTPVNELRLTLTGVRMGTPKYMAPEQVEGPEAVDHRADIYSLGVVLYEMLTGELPVGRFPAPSQVLGVDRRFDEVVYKLLETKPARRYQQADDIKTDLEIIARAGLLGDRRADPTPRWKPNRTQIALASGALLAGTATAWYASNYARVGSRTVATGSEASGVAVASGSRIPLWHLEGPAPFAATIDRKITPNQKPSLLLQNRSSSVGTAMLLQSIRADDYRGKRMRFSGQLRSRDVLARAGLCMRVEGSGLVFSHDVDRADVRGTTDWKRCEVVLDIPPHSDRISIGVQLTGPGEVWMGDLDFEVVGPEVPVTGRKLADTLPGAPQFDFDR